MPQDKIKIKVDIDAKKLQASLQELLKELKRTGAVSEQAFNKLQAELRQTTQEVKRVQGGISKFRKLVAGIAIGGGVLMGVSMLTSKIRALNSHVKEWIKLAADERLAISNLAQGLKNVGDYREENIKLLVRQANEIQRLTGVSNTEILHAQKILTTFMLTSDEIKMLIPQIVNMSVAMKKLGKADYDLQQIAIAVGKALTMGAGALSRYGIVMSEAQKKQLRYAQGAEKVKLVTEILAQNFDKFAEATGKNAMGSMMKLQSALDDLKKQLGHIALDVLKPIIDNR